MLATTDSASSVLAYSIWLEKMQCHLSVLLAIPTAILHDTVNICVAEQ